MPKTYDEAVNDAGLSQKEVYIALGISKQTWSSIKNYEIQIKGHHLLKFCDLVGCEPRDILVKGFNY